MTFETAFFGIETLLNQIFCEEWDSKLHYDVGVSREIPPPWLSKCDALHKTDDHSTDSRTNFSVF